MTTTNEYGETYEGYTGDTEKLIYPATVRFEDLPLPQTSILGSSLWLAVVAAMVIAVSFVGTVLILKLIFEATPALLAMAGVGALLAVVSAPLVAEQIKDTVRTVLDTKKMIDGE